MFGNFLLADEINRAPAKVQSALLEVMQEHQVTIGGQTFPMPEPFLVLATQNPIESEGTYPLPEAQVDRFLMKVVVDYPTPGRGGDRGAARDRRRREVEERLSVEELLRYRAGRAERLRGPRRGRLRGRAGRRHPPPRALRPGELETLIDYGASPRGPIGLIQSAQALALLRGRRYVLPGDVRDLALDVLRHRLVLSYEALSDGVAADELLEQVLDAVPEPGVEAGPPEEALAA